MAEINKIIHQPARLRIMATLSAIEVDAELDFTYLRNKLELTDGNLGAHLEKLQTSRYIRIRKTFVGKKPRTYISMTRTGRRQFEDHIDALKAIIEGKTG